MIKRLYNSFCYKFLSPNNFARKKGVTFGDNCIFRTKHFGSEPFLIEVGNNFATANNVYFVTHDGGLSVVRKLHNKFSKADIFKKIIIGDNVFIGINTVILLGTTIGDNVIVGAGSIVKGNLKSNSIYAGSPAKFICTIDEYIEKNNKDYDFTYGMNPLDKKNFIINKFKSK